jgi:hypothetical protein
MGNRELRELLLSMLTDLCEMFKHNKSAVKKIEDYFYDNWGVVRNVRL